MTFLMVVGATALLNSAKHDKKDEAFCHASAVIALTIIGREDAEIAVPIRLSACALSLIIGESEWEWSCS